MNCISNKVVFYLAILPWLFLHFAKAQDTIALKEIDVTATRPALSSIGKKSETIDTVTKQQFIYNSVGDILSFNSPVFIKNYGPGGLSTSAFRGGNASQTAVVWNGFNIQNGMLGQVDFSLLPSVLFDKITVEYGGSSSLWGSGAVGGSIHLENKSSYNRGLTTIANLGLGSFGLFNASTNVDYSNRKFTSTTKAYLQNSLNDYRYKDTLDKVHPYKTQNHATYTFSGVLQEFRFLVNPKQTLGINIWYNKGARQIPTFNSAALSKPEQMDGNFKTSINWNYFSNKFTSTIRSAVFHDQLNYTDSAYLLFSKSSLLTIIAENENTLKWNKNMQLNFGANFTSYNGTTDNYNGSEFLSKTGIFAGNKFSFLDEKLTSYISFRAEYFSTGKNALTGNISLEYKLSKKITAKANAARVYRQPTLNELYWVPGGNRNLLPEEGYTGEGDLSYRNTFGRYSLVLSSSAYARTIKDWILWLPAPYGATPVNIQQVFSRGTETSSRLSWQKNKLILSAGLISGYVLSTVQSSKQENDNTQAKQLIYTPRYTINANLSVQYGPLIFSAYHQYIGYRFTSSDNLQWLPPYHYTSTRINYKARLQAGTTVILFAACHNLFNTNYSVMAGRYMPLRNYEIGISLSNNKPNKQKQPATTPQ